MSRLPQRYLLLCGLLMTSAACSGSMDDLPGDEDPKGQEDRAQDRVDMSSVDKTDQGAQVADMPSGSDAALSLDMDSPGPDFKTPQAQACAELPLAAPWTLTKVGPQVAAAGAAMTPAGDVCLRGGGEDIWGEEDHFLFVSQPRSGDFTLTGRVRGFRGEDHLAKFGLMVRASLSSQASHATLHVSPKDIGHFLTSRFHSAQSTQSEKLSPSPESTWLRLSRLGSLIVGERSADGASWETVGQVRMESWGESAHVGIAITGHDGEASLVDGAIGELKWGVPEPPMSGCGDGVCGPSETCTICAADCSCERQGIPQSPYVKTDAPRSIPRPTTSSPVVHGGLRYTLLDPDLRHYYSNVPSFNADDSLIVLGGSRGSLYDAKTLRKVRDINAAAFSPGHRAWLNTPANRTKQFGVSQTAAYLFDVMTDKRELLKDFSDEYEDLKFGPGEGSVSNDDTTVALVGKKDGDAHVMAFDLVGKRVLGKKVFKGRWPRGEEKPRFDHAMISASGKWVVLNIRNHDSGGHLRYDTAFKTELQVTPVGKHSDVCVNQAGEDVLVALSSPTHGMYRLSDGQKQQLPTLNQRYAGHVSCQNTKRPGWAYVSRKDTKELMALKLDDTKTVERFGWHFSTEHNYSAEAHGGASRDGSRMIFNSDWGDTGRLPVAYLVEKVR